jgi:hypothetical protein
VIFESAPAFDGVVLAGALLAGALLAGALLAGALLAGALLAGVLLAGVLLFDELLFDELQPASSPIVARPATVATSLGLNFIVSFLLLLGEIREKH